MRTRIPLPNNWRHHQIVAVLRAPVQDFLLPVALELHDLGVRAIEIALTSPGALAIMEELASRIGHEAEIGAGTVLTQEQVHHAADAGATYLLSPTTDERVMRAALERGLPFIPGAGTATEIARAWDLGASAVKVFPASSLGGPGFIRSIRDPLPHISLMPTGGIQASQVDAYFEAGAVALGIGSPLTGDALTGGDVADLRKRIALFMAESLRK